MTAATLPDVPTRRDALAAALDRLTAEIPEDAREALAAGMQLLAEAEASAGASARHAARTAAVKTALLAEAAALGEPDEAASRALILGAAALLGAGGTKDGGGPGCASSLPVLPWLRHQARCGDAWVAALREAVVQLSTGVDVHTTVAEDGPHDLRIAAVLYDDAPRLALVVGVPYGDDATTDHVVQLAAERCSAIYRADTWGPHAPAVSRLCREVALQDALAVDGGTLPVWHAYTPMGRVVWAEMAHRLTVAA